MEMLDLFKLILIVQIFFGSSITIIVHSLPGSVQGDMLVYTDFSERMSLSDISSKVEGNLNSQTKAPGTDIAALVLYSGNLLVDLLLNFVFAIPEMLTIVISGITLMVGVDYFIVAQIQLFVGVLFSVLYLIAILQFFTKVRTGQIV